MNDYRQSLEVSRKAALHAGKLIMDLYKSGDFSIDSKSDESPLTQADLKADEYIQKTLSAAFLDIPILSEETKDDRSRLSSSLVFIVDPLDGTKEFISKNGEFTVNIGLVKDRKPIMGVIYAPAIDELYYSLQGKGAFMLKGSDTKKIHVSKRDMIEDMSLVMSRSHASQKIKDLIQNYHFKNTKSRGSSLKGCMVASGDADVYLRLGPTNEWDICAMSAIIEEAGGKITSPRGEPMLFNSPNPLNNGFVLSNGTIHNTLVSLVDSDG